MTVTGIPKQGASVNYVISSAATNLPLSIAWTPSTCTYPTYNYFITDSNAGDVSQVLTISSTNIQIYNNDLTRATQTLSIRYWAIPVANPSQAPIYETFQLTLTNPCLTWTTPVISNPAVSLALL
jgi:hypothetical protein